MANDPDVTPDHFKWLVEARSRNQRATLELYSLIVKSGKILNNNLSAQEAAQSLTSVAFSLWRAIFLSDLSEETEQQTADTKRFLISLISDNTVVYQTDKNARNWSFRYYLDNALFRLGKLSEDSINLIDQAAIELKAATEKDRWINAQTALEGAVQRFAISLKELKASGLPS